MYQYTRGELHHYTRGKLYHCTSIVGVSNVHKLYISTDNFNIVQIQKIQEILSFSSILALA